MAEAQRQRGCAESPAGAELSARLRRWWEAAGRERDGKPPAQESLARRVGVAQTTLSRYLNPVHRSTAPVEVVRKLHAALNAPPDELGPALELARAAADTATTAPPIGKEPPRRAWRWTRATRAAVCALTAVGLFWTGWEGARLFPPQARRSAAAVSPGPSATPTARAEWPTVRPGDRGSLVWTVQRLLKVRRQPVRLTGIFDTATKSRVVAFQHDSGLQPDGLVGARTWSMLAMATAPGDTGPQVEAVQNLLARAGWPADITGRFTAATHQSLLGFQREHGLPATGTADTATWLALTTAERRP
ncbi:peptidoglycan-binding protein [Streptomyces sp. NPDC058145]|uniref:peptidoglycan-binding protein n=1 Tax=Streptomyces sp. NPDC058145 TaxID=3346356 RepID=UPI0036EC465D